MTGAAQRFQPGGRRLPPPGWGVLLAAQAALVVVGGLVTSAVWAAGQEPYYWPRWVWFGLTVNVAAQYAVRWGLRRPRGSRAIAVHGALTAVYALLDVAVWALAGGGWFWPGASVPAAVLAWVVHLLWRRRPSVVRERELASRVAVLSRTRSSALDVQAAELKRIERDLHDGAQARMVSLAMNLGLASELLSRDPDTVAELLVEARATTLTALAELRTVMEGIQPPVLADRGLVGAVEAVALDLAVPVTVTADVPGRLEAPVESAVYFAVTECLANVVKHSRASRAWVRLVHAGDTLTVLVGDDGCGGADPGAGTGLRGVVRRLEVFDGILAVESPAGGPTQVTMEVRCALSSPRISPSSGTA
ncbi:MAG: histidine kinase [Actinomycetia bacterium]|nr:histidine kinase [Actinomycetes bacterium]